MELKTTTQMNGKPVFYAPAKTVLNLNSGFRHKLLCDGPTFSAGSACTYSCSFCYVPDLMQKSPHMQGIEAKHHEVVVRRTNAIELLRKQLTTAKGKPKFPDPSDNRVLYASPLVDVAGNVELMNETIEACKLILDLTHWHIRLLSKSNLLPKIAEALAISHPDAKNRVIYGVSTGTPDDDLAKSFEQGTALVSKRIQSLHWLQDNGFRTYGMICPSLPQRNYDAWAKTMHDMIRAEKCEHVWAECMNARGESFERTVQCLRAAGYSQEADDFTDVTKDEPSWEAYSRTTFEAHAKLYKPRQLRFLQYVKASTKEWWKARESEGAILL